MDCLSELQVNFSQIPGELQVNSRWTPDIVSSTWSPSELGMIIWLHHHPKKIDLDSRWTQANHLESSGVHLN